MKILLEKIKKLEQLEKAADEAESRWTAEPENAEFDAYISTAKYIEHITDGAVDFMKAKELIQTKRAELLQLLA